MSTASHHKQKKTSHASDGARQTLLLEPAAAAKRQQKTQFYLSDTFLTILLALVALMFLIILAAAIALLVTNTSPVYSSVRVVDAVKTNGTTGSNESTIIVDNRTILDITTTAAIEVVTSPLELLPYPDDEALPQGVHIQEGFEGAPDD